MSVFEDERYKKLVRLLMELFQRPPSYYDNPQNIREDVKRVGSWKKAAELIDENGVKLYKWFHETLLRNVCYSVCAEDKQLIKNEITMRLLYGKDVGLKFQLQLKERLKFRYQRCQFSSVFHNILRCTQNQMEKCRKNYVEFIAFYELRQ